MRKYHWFVDGHALCNRKTSGYSAHTRDDITCSICKRLAKSQDILEDRTMSQFDQGYAEFFPSNAQVGSTDHTNADSYSGDIVGGERINWFDHSQAIMHGPNLEKIMVWLTDAIYNGVGVIALGTTEDGSIGVWYPFREGDEKQESIGSGGDAFEALYDAIPKDWTDQGAAEQLHQADADPALAVDSVSDNQ